MGFYNKIDARQTGYQIMNPTLLELPRGGNSSHDFLVIARTKHIAKNIHHKQYQLARQIASFANLTYDSFGRPLLKTGKWSKLLVEDFGVPEHHCKGQPNIDKYIGPEDMKLFWTRTGEPLLIFTHQVNDKNMCQGQFLIDVRAALVELEQVLGPEFSSLLPPIRFASPVGLRRDAPPGQENHPRYQREKNWAPGQSPFGSVSELLLMAEPGQLFRWISNDEPVELVLGAKDHRSAVEEPYPATAKPGETWHSRKSMTCVHDVMLHDEHVHQSTPMLTLTLCHRGSCEPDRQNTVMLGMVQRRQDPPAAPFTCFHLQIMGF
ncbi:hypothetical protein FOQG_13388 [Fusarium oxysporum f. sp. raphani 54005]|uniref:Uncharacterized protein n=1 Tax=Fusarium oxysporum f. sp. raphani 54005 TaxID=1089458 RepID=X0BJD2_FUSOX|nr:hypothetical protein FOQG_13388 [Fusarium oxysporum f. sp. raphani 54005]